MQCNSLKKRGGAALLRARQVLAIAAMFVTLFNWQPMRRTLLEAFGTEPLYCFLDKVAGAASRSGVPSAVRCSDAIFLERRRCA